MAYDIEDLYRVRRDDITRAGITLAAAFQHDATWRLFFRSEATLEQKGLLFQGPIRYCLRYGSVYATSEDLEGVAAWVPGEYADMTAWRLIRCGGLISGIRALPACTKLASQQRRIFAPLQEAREANMAGRSYVYLFVIGVAAQFQRQGFGSKLMAGLIAKSDEDGLPIYTETQTKENVRWYEGLGFRRIGEIILPVIHLPQWEMIREPGA
jgi:ribosomal protein S18 acetylase RimI-like enzyme